MAWTDNLRKASFRGVAFLVEDQDTEFGRRNVLHQYPKRDIPYAEDLGKKAREFTIRAYVLGDDTPARRDALMRAIEDKATPGTLVHPLLGSMLVIPTTCRHRITQLERRIEYFELSFIEAGQNRYPDQSVVDSQGQALTAAQTARETIKQVFGGSFNVTNLPAFVADDASSILVAVAQQILQAAAIRSQISGPSADLLASVSAFQANLADFLPEPVTLADQVDSLIAGVTTVYTNPLDAYTGLKRLAAYGADLPVITPTTTTRRQQLENQQALVRLTRRAALTAMVETTAAIAFDSYNQAVAIRDDLADLIDGQLLAIGDTDEDQAYLQLDGMRAAMVADVTRRAANLERIREIVPGRVRSALATSFDVYGTAARAEEIVTRNGIRHPGFVPAGQPLQVLI